MMDETTSNDNETTVKHSVSETVENMHKHFARTGTYKSEDFTRVFGDPRRGVGYELTNGYAASMIIKKK